MAKTVQQYLAEQDRAVLASFLDDGWCICAAISLDALAELAGKRAAVLEDLPGYARAEAVVVRRKGFAELWVQARRRDYTTAFRSFAQHCCGFTTAHVPAGYHVDHLFSKGRVQTAGADPDVDERLPHATLVRMLLVAAPVNQSFGGLMESAMVGSGNAQRPVRRFTYLQLAKALSIDANLLGGGLTGANQAANFAHVVQQFDRRGVLAGLGMSAEQMLGQLLTQAQTVQHFRNAG